MLKTYLYVPDFLDKQIKEAALLQNQSKAEIMRQALTRGIVAIENQTTASAQALFKVAEIGRKYKLKGPKNGSEKMDGYLWDQKWGKDE